MTTKNKSKKTSSDRITISLAPGQRKALEDLADQNGAPISFVVRYAINEFLEKHEDRQIPLTFRRT